MLKHFAFILLTYMALVLQTTAVDASGGVLRPSFPAVVLAFAVLTMRGSAAVMWGGVIGLAADCLTPDPLGPGLIAGTLACWFVKRRLHQQSAESVFALLSAGSLAILVFLLSATTLRGLLAGRASDLPGEIVFAAGSAAFSAMIAAGLILVALAGMKLAPRLFPFLRRRGASRWQMLVE